MSVQHRRGVQDTYGLAQEENALLQHVQVPIITLVVTTDAVAVSGASEEDW